MKKFYGVIAAVSTVVAALVASSACYWFLYQPEEPVSLRNE
ncbi:MAG: cyclic lactone autoinducer peptide [Eubacteriales bacterium]|nr:cyclic lactone autoinducer peptide [Eubacteriales bacterium]